MKIKKLPTQMEIVLELYGRGDVEDNPIFIRYFQIAAESAGMTPTQWALYRRKNELSRYVRE